MAEHESDVIRLSARIRELEEAVRQAGKELQQSEQRYRIFLENAPEALVVLNPTTGRFVDVNENATTMFGRSRDELLTMGPVELSPPHQPDGKPSTSAAERIAEAIAGGNPVFEWVHLHRSGRPVFCEIRLVTLPSREGTLIRGSLTDITERKAADSALRKSRELYRNLFDNATDVIYTHDLEGRFTSVNAAVLRETGYIVEEFLQLNVADIVAPDCLAEVRRMTQEKLQGQRSTTYETRLVHRKGHVFTVEINSSILLEDGLPAGVQGIVRNVDERRRAEREIAALQKFYATILDNLPARVTVFDPQGCYLYVNPAEIESSELRLAAIGRSQLAGSELTGVDALIARRRHDAVLCCIDTQRLVSFEETLPADGQDPLYLVRLYSPVMGQDGQVSNVIGYGLDITERKLAEIERLRWEEKVRHSQKLESLGVLAGGIAHDFNNLLMGIIGNSSLVLQDIEAGSPVWFAVNDMQTAAERAAELTRQLLAYSGKGQFVVEPFDLNLLVREMTNLLEISISKRALLRLDLAPELPAIDADATQIRQVVMNLITNASDALMQKDGSITIRTCVRRRNPELLRNTYLHEEPGPGDYVALEVLDTGCGMEPATLSRLFDPFFTTKFAGRGLGLAAVLGIVRSHHGTVEVESEVDQGTRISVLFPASSKPARELIPESTGRNDWRYQGTVLIVDDEATVRKLGRMMLKRAGFEVLTAADGRQAVDLFEKRQSEISFVLLDLTMPRMNGEETFRELRKIDPRVRVLFSSGYDEQESPFSDSTGTLFIQKPYRVEQLLSKARALLERGPSAKSSPPENDVSQEWNEAGQPRP